MTEGPRRIVVSSRALGPRLYVTVYVHDTVEELRRLGELYNRRDDHADSIGITHATTYRDTGRTASVTVRLAREHLGTAVVVHEMHHASTEWYGSQVGERINRKAHLTNHNEPFAHLHSDLTYRLVDRLHELGYYRKAT